jgi:anti-anti-sigma factor
MSIISKERKGTKMKIEVKQDGEIFVVELEGRMDTNTSPEFQKEMEAYYTKQGFNMILDFDKLDFVSSAGLRVLLLIQKKSKALSGSLVIKNVKPEIQEVFDMTGFSDILTIE